MPNVTVIEPQIFGDQREFFSTAAQRADFQKSLENTSPFVRTTLGAGEERIAQSYRFVQPRRNWYG